MSKRMGVSEDVVNKIKAQYERDLQTRKERIALVIGKPFWVEENSKDKVLLTRPSARWLSNWLYGLDSLPGDKSLLELLKAVLVCAAGIPFIF